MSAFRSFISRELQAKILERCHPVPGVDGMLRYPVAAASASSGAACNIETERAMHFIAELKDRTTPMFDDVMQQREDDRAFIDKRTAELSAEATRNRIAVTSPLYPTVIGEQQRLQDGTVRVPVGALQPAYFSGKGKAPVAPVPKFLQGPHITIFGPPDTAAISVDAMNCVHRRLPTEPAVVQRLVDAADYEPKWGADCEDSKTPLHGDLVAAARNLAGCFDGTLAAHAASADGTTTATRHLAATRRAVPLKRLPGLALPCTFLFHDGRPVPLHIYDLVLHLAANHMHKEALAFYMPKLETEAEARYLCRVFTEAEDILCSMHPGEYARGAIRVITVMETARAIFRLNEIADALHPFFAGASLGWHDFIASTARLFKNDANYRMPVKADPNIVIKYVKASHQLVANVAGGRGGAAIGGMYGVLPPSDIAGATVPLPPTAEGDRAVHELLRRTTQAEVQSRVFQVTLKGFFCDIVVQLRRGLNGFWVAHPDFVRVGIALVEAWNNNRADPRRRDELLAEIISGYLSDEELRKQALDFCVPRLRSAGADAAGAAAAGDDDGVAPLDTSDPLYPRKLLAADVGPSTVIANNHPDEVRYNVFQCLQYMAEWLQGRGCVSLPAVVAGAHVRVMDDLATTERSRWEVWHEIRHGRFSRDEFLKLARDEFDLIKRGGTDSKIVHVKYVAGTDSAKWYEVAFKIVVRLMLPEDGIEPPEWVTELMLPFTVPLLRDAEDPWKAAQQIDPHKFRFTC